MSLLTLLKPRAPGIVGYTTAERTTNGLTLVVPVPTYTADDALYIAWADDGDGGSASISGTGWTAVVSDYTIPSTGVADSGSFYLWRRVAGSEPASYTVTATVSERAVAIAFVVRDDDGIDATGTSANGTDANITANAVTTTKNSALRFSIIASVSDKTPVGTLTGHTVLATHTFASAATISVQYKALPAAGTDGSATTTQTGNGWTSHVFAVAAPGVGTNALTANDITAGTPTLGTPTIAGANALTATGITAGTPTLGTPAIAQKHVLTAVGITTGLPSLGAPTIAQTHALNAAGITTSTPSLGTPTLGQVHALVAIGIVAGTPTLGTPALGQAQGLVALGVTAGTPTLGAPTLAEIYVFVALGIVTGAPTLGTPGIGQVHALTAAGITTRPPTVGTPRKKKADAGLLPAKSAQLHPHGNLRQ